MSDTSTRFDPQLSTDTTLGPSRHLRPFPASKPRRPYELDDRDWLETHAIRHTDREIGRILGVHHDTVRKARKRLNIPGDRPGPRRGNPQAIGPNRQQFTYTKPIPVDHTLDHITRLYHELAAADAPPTWQSVLVSLRDAQDARDRHDRTAECQAARNLAATAARLAHQLAHAPQP